MGETVIPGDPYGVVRVDQGNLAPSGPEVANFHKNSDRDRSVSAEHHTLGPRRNQASPGDHTHDGRLSRKLGEGLNLVLTGYKDENASTTLTAEQLEQTLESLVDLLFQVVSFTDSRTEL